MSLTKIVIQMTNPITDAQIRDPFDFPVAASSLATSSSTPASSASGPPRFPSHSVAPDGMLNAEREQAKIKTEEMPRNATTGIPRVPPSHPAIVEWRAMTVGLLQVSLSVSLALVAAKFRLIEEPVIGEGNETS
ncbi:hypothetical protein B0H13DRAFT_2321999 [Mycena leptocephala]|nr:hypothetical protein B0H13DRAFT_2321999 [Mycena leptocephala]